MGLHICTCEGWGHVGTPACEGCGAYSALGYFYSCSVIYENGCGTTLLGNPVPECSFSGYDCLGGNFDEDGNPANSQGLFFDTCETVMGSCEWCCGCNCWDGQGPPEHCPEACECGVAGFNINTKYLFVPEIDRCMWFDCNKDAYACATYRECSGQI